MGDLERDDGAEPAGLLSDAEGAVFLGWSAFLHRRVRSLADDAIWKDLPYSVRVQGACARPRERPRGIIETRNASFPRTGTEFRIAGPEEDVVFPEILD